MILKHIQHLVNNLNQIHICINSSKMRINVRVVLHVYEWYVMCCVLYSDSLVWQHFGTQPIQQLMGHLMVKPGYLVDMPEEQNTTSGLMGCHEQNKLRKQREIKKTDIIVAYEGRLGW